MFLADGSFLHKPIIQFFLCLPVYIVGILYFGKSAYNSIKNSVPNMDVLIFIGSTSAFLGPVTVAGGLATTESAVVAIDNNEPIALAGVMGGLDTEVTNETQNLLIESAYFDKVSIMKTSRKLNLISDASVRFERGIDRNIQAYGLKRFTNLYELDEMIQYSEISDSTKQTERENFITFDTSLIESVLGQVIDNKFITLTLESLSIESDVKKDTIKFKQPSWRYDLERPLSLIHI